MTVNELIKKLRSYPQDVMVVLPVYEDGNNDYGYNELCGVKKIPLTLGKSESKEYGKYEQNKVSDNPILAILLWSEMEKSNIDAE